MSGLTITYSISLYLSLWSLNAESKVRYITHLNPKKVSSSCATIRSALSSGIDLTIIGVEDTTNKQANKLKVFEDSLSARKILEISDFFQNSSHNSFGDNDIVVYNDGSNTLYSSNQTNLENTFLRVEKSNTILFPASRDCWTGIGGCAEPDTSILSSFKYATASGWIARYNVAANFFTVWSKVLESQAKEYRNDQWALLQISLSKGSLNPGVIVAVDHGCSIFQTTNDTNILSDLFSAHDSSSTNPSMRSDGTIYNHETNTEPFFFHFDEEDSILTEVEEEVWNARKQQLESSPALETGCELLTSKYPAVSTCRINQVRVRPSVPPSAFSSFFPAEVSVFHVRKDVTTERPVQRDRVRLLAGKKHTLSEYLKILQCPKVQLELHGRGGALSLARHIPLTRETVLLTAAYAESDCLVWNGCRKVVKEFLNGSYPKDASHFFLGGFSNVKMYRVMNGTMYYDWPWGIERIKLGGYDENFRLLFFHVLNHVTDIPDSIFFSGCETSTMKPNMPVPAFSSSPEGYKSSDMPAPWNAPYQYQLARDSVKLFQSLSAEKVLKEYRPEGITFRRRDRTLFESWANRIDKAAFFGSMSDMGLRGHAIARQVVMNIAINHPEHVIANWSRCFELTDINPASKNVTSCLRNDSTLISNYKETPQPFGFGDRVVRSKLREHFSIEQYMLSYRYLVVIGGISSADRLNTFLAHSGAVILLQETDFLYHYSAFLKPWVHYVPLAFNCADLVEKVLWLKANPRRAERLASNARNFGASYLRTEDYYCYAAAALAEVAKVAAPSALLPFNAKLLPMDG